MGKSATAASVQEVLAVEPVIRRVVAARTANPADIDDLVQDCLERLLSAHKRLDAGAVLPYAIVTARNLVAAHATSAARRSRTAHRILDLREPDLPEDVVLTGESRRAMLAALSRLSPDERRELLTYYGHAGHARPGPGDSAPGGPGRETGPGRSRGALRVQMARTRAKLRLEYLLAFRHIELPTPECYRVLLSISGGDTRRQRELNAGQHLLDCETCAKLSEPLDRRSIALTGIAVPAGLLGWLVNNARAHPAHATAATATATAAAVTAVVLVSNGPSAHRPDPSPPAPASVKVISHLTIAGRPVPQAAARHSIRSMIGQPARASGATVQSVVAHNGFWVGTASARLWVQLVGPLQPLHVEPGERVRFTGTVVGNKPSYPGRAGVGRHQGAGLLAAQGAHLNVKTTKIVVTRAR